MLHIHRAERADGLVGALGGMLAEAPADPFAREVVSVPTRGVERWLAQSLSTAARGLRERRLPSAAAAARRCRRGRGRDRRRGGPVASRARRLAAAGGRRRVARRAVVPRARDATSRGRLGGRGGSARVRHLAGLFDRYSLYRPELLEGWASGRVRPLAGRALAAARRPRSTFPSPVERMTARVRAAARGRRGRRPSSARLALRPDAAAGGPPPRPRGARRAPRRPSVRAASAPGAVGADGGARRAVEAEGGRDAGRPAEPASRLVGAGLARAAAGAGRRRAASRTTTTRSSTTRATLLQRIQARRAGRPLRRGTRRRSSIDERPQRPGPRVPRPRAAGRGHAGRDPPPPRGGRHARAARRHRHVPGHRDVRAAHPGDVRRGRGLEPTTRTSSTRCRRTSGRRTCASGWRTARCARRTRCSASCRGSSSWRPSGSPRARCSTSPTASRCAAGSGFDDDDLTRIEDWVADSGIRWGLDAEHRRPFKLDALRREHVAGGPRPRARRRDDDRGRAAAVRGARCRSTTSTAARSTSPAASPSWSTASRRRDRRTSPTPKTMRRVGDVDRRRGRRAHARRRSATRGSARSSSASSTTSPASRAGRRRS